MRRFPLPRSRAGRVLLVLGGLFGAFALLVTGLVAWTYSRADMSNVGELDFANELAVPPLAEPRIDADGTKVFDLRFTAGETHLRGSDESATATRGLNGTYLGPTLRASRGDEVQVEVTNGVDETTTLHWHGMNVPARMDGGPHQTVEPGATWSPTWTIDQPAATVWYHPHMHGRTADHVYRGAAGMFLIDDPAESDVAEALPHTYGVDDVPLIIQDKSFADDGSLRSTSRIFSNLGTMGDTILVNGTYDPHFVATTELVRFRVLNASNARVYNLGFPDGRSFWQVASDSGLLERPHETDRLQLTPGERAEIVVAVEPGDRAVLRSFGPDLGGLGPLERFYGGNGRHMDMDRIDEEVTAGTTEIWEISNNDGFPHSFHPHLVHFIVLEVGGDPPPPELSGWKDTVFVPPNETVRIIARFDGEPDPATPYMLHCHVLRHEDKGMMGQFVLVEEGEDRTYGMPARSAGLGAEPRAGDEDRTRISSLGSCRSAIELHPQNRFGD